MLAHDGGIITPKVLWLGGATRRGDGRLARQEAPAAVGAATIVRLGGARVNGGGRTRRGYIWKSESVGDRLASDAEADDIFASSVAVNGDTAVVGAPQEDAGAATPAPPTSSNATRAAWTTGAR